MWKIVSAVNTIKFVTNELGLGYIFVRVCLRLIRLRTKVILSRYTLWLWIHPAVMVSTLAVLPKIKIKYASLVSELVHNWCYPTLYKAKHSFLCLVLGWISSVVVSNNLRPNSSASIMLLLWPMICYVAQWEARGCQ
jgi:hypothetical protein